MRQKPCRFLLDAKHLTELQRRDAFRRGKNKPQATQPLPPPAPQAEPYTADLAAPHLDVLPRSAEERARIAAVTASPESFDRAEPFAAKPGGAASVRAHTTPDAFSQPSANIPFAREFDFKIGNRLFKKLWAMAPRIPI